MHRIYKNPFLSADKSIKMPSEVTNRTPGSLRQYSYKSPAVMTRFMWDSVVAGEGPSFGTETLCQKVIVNLDTSLLCAT